MGTSIPVKTVYSLTYCSVQCDEVCRHGIWAPETCRILPRRCTTVRLRISTDRPRIDDDDDVIMTSPRCWARDHNQFLLCLRPTGWMYYAMLLSDVCLSDVCLSVCLSVAYIGRNLRTERPRNTKIGTGVAHVIRDSDTTFKFKRTMSTCCWCPK